MGNQTKADKFCSYFKPSNIPGVFILCACIVGAVSLIFIPGIFGVSAYNLENNQIINRGMYDENNRLIPTGNGYTAAFSLQQLYKPIPVRVQSTTLFLNIDNKDAITSWHVSDNTIAEIAFFPFRIYTRAEGTVTITLTANRRVGELVFPQTRTMTITVKGHA